jgi:hypothetical protein
MSHPRIRQRHRPTRTSSLIRCWDPTVPRLRWWVDHILSLILPPSKNIWSRFYLKSNLSNLTNFILKSSNTYDVKLVNYESTFQTESSETNILSWVPQHFSKKMAKNSNAWFKIRGRSTLIYFSWTWPMSTDTRSVTFSSMDGGHAPRAMPPLENLKRRGHAHWNKRHR